MGSVTYVLIGCGLALSLGVESPPAGSSHCFRRIAGGERLVGYDVTRIVERSSVGECEEECNVYGCTHFSFGNAADGNGTCELTTDRQISRRQDPNFDVFEKTTECAEGKPTGYEKGKPHTKPLQPTEDIIMVIADCISAKWVTLPWRNRSQLCTCYRRIITGKRLHERFIRHSLPCNSLQACQHQCSIEKHFTCQGFNIRLNPAGLGRGICELSSIDTTHLDFSRDFVFAPDFAYYERDHQNGLPNCGFFTPPLRPTPPHSPLQPNLPPPPEDNALGGPYHGGDSYGPWGSGHGTIDHGPWGSRGYGSGFFQPSYPSTGPPPSFDPNTPHRGPYFGYTQTYGYGYGYGADSQSFGPQGLGGSPHRPGFSPFPAPQGPYPGYDHGGGPSTPGSRLPASPPRGPSYGSNYPFLPGKGPAAHPGEGPGWGSTTYSAGYPHRGGGPGWGSTTYSTGDVHGGQSWGTTTYSAGYSHRGEGPSWGTTAFSSGDPNRRVGSSWGTTTAGDTGRGQGWGITGDPNRRDGPGWGTTPYSGGDSHWGGGTGWGTTTYSAGYPHRGGGPSWGTTGDPNRRDGPGWGTTTAGDTGRGQGWGTTGDPNRRDGPGWGTTTYSAGYPHRGGGPSWGTTTYSPGDTHRGDRPGWGTTTFSSGETHRGQTWGTTTYSPGDRRYDKTNRTPTYIIIDAGIGPWLRGTKPKYPSYRPSTGYLPSRPPVRPPPRQPRPPHPPISLPPYGIGSSTVASEVCFRREHPGYKLNPATIKGMYDTATLLDCEALCTNSPFKCTGYSFRYSSSGSGPNCLLTDYTALDPQTHLLPDRSCDVYFRMGTCVEFERSSDTECFLKVTNNRMLHPSKVVKAVSVSGMSECELACLSSGVFTCRSFSFRHGPAVIGEALENCFLSDWPMSALTHSDLIPAPGHEVYERGSFGHGCELEVGPFHIGPRPPFTPYPNIPQISFDKGAWGLEETWKHFTVSGWPCRRGTVCELDPLAGFWACEVEGGDHAQWDYCCQPKHSCGFSRGYQYPWCYVGEAGPEQWRPCSQFYFPEFDNRFPYKPVQSQTPHPFGPPKDIEPWNFGSEEFGPPASWPISYIYAEPPPNETYFWDPEDNFYGDEGPKDSPRIRFKPCRHKRPYPRAIIQKLDLKHIPKAPDPEEQSKKDSTNTPKPEAETISPDNRNKKSSLLTNNSESNKTKEVIKTVEKLIMENAAGVGGEKNESLKEIESRYPKYPDYFSVSLLKEPDVWR